MPGILKAALAQVLPRAGWRGRIGAALGRALLSPLRLIPRTQAGMAMLACVTVLVALLVAFKHFTVPAIYTHWALAVPAVAFGGLLMHRLRFNRWVVALTMAGLSMYISYWSYTKFDERNLDGKAQVKYVSYISRNLTVPPDDHCFICHHPPVYYGSAAAVHKLCAATGIANPVRGTQLYSIALVFALVIFSLLIIRRFTTRPWALTLGCAVLMFWPYNVIFSARIHNDVMLATLCVASLYFVVKWHQEDRYADFFWAAALAVAATLTKNNGAVMVGTLGIVAAYKFLLADRKLAFVARVAPIFVLVLGGLGAHALTRGQKKEKEDEDGKPIQVTERLLGSAFRIGERAFVGNDPFNYFYFDTEIFVREPYLLARRNGTGRQYLLNHVIKSSLFSTHNHHPDAETSYRLNARIAGLINVLLLAGLLYTASVVVRLERSMLRRYLAPITCALAFFFALVAFRVTVPHSHHSDFRMVYPMLAVGCLGFVMAVQWYRRRGSLWQHVGYGIAVAFVALSAIYWIPKYEYLLRLLPTNYIHRQASEVRKRVKEKTKWDAKGNIKLEGNDVLVVDFDGATTVGWLDLTFDHNDKYQISVIGGDDVRVLELGPYKQKTKSKKDYSGMARYREPVSPPVEGVERIEIKPLSGDYRYSVGHVIPRARKPSRIEADDKPARPGKRKKPAKPRKRPGAERDDQEPEKPSPPKGPW